MRAFHVLSTDPPHHPFESWRFWGREPRSDGEMSTNLWQRPKLTLGSVLDSAELQTMDEKIPEADQSLAHRDVDHLTPALISGALRPGARLNQIGRASCRERVCKYV